MRRSTIALTLVSCFALASVANVSTSAEKPPKTWDGLEQVKAKRFDLVYLLPDADFKPYTKVIIDPPEVAFRKNWQKDYNATTTGLSSRISDDEVRKALELAKTGFSDVFTKAYRDAGYQIVTTPGHDTMRVKTGVINIDVYAPERRTAGRSDTYAPDAGQATLVLEARDSMSNALLGRAVDARIAGEGGPYRRNSMTNRSDFKRLFQTWAKISVTGLEDLKTTGNPA